MVAGITRKRLLHNQQCKDRLQFQCKQKGSMGYVLK